MPSVAGEREENRTSPARRLVSYTYSHTHTHTRSHSHTYSDGAAGHSPEYRGGSGETDEGTRRPSRPVSHTLDTPINAHYTKSN